MKILIALLSVLAMIAGHNNAVEKQIRADNNKTGELYIITAYCGCEKCCEKTDRITASGTVATQGRTIAVDCSEIPYGTEVEIEELGIFIAEDCGGAVKGRRIDIYFDTHEEAMEFGKQERIVYIKEEN